MLTYQVRKRVLLNPSDPSKSARLRFPNEGEVRFTLEPGGQFGSGELSAHVLLEGVYVSLEPDLNTGRYCNSVPRHMEPISVRLPDVAASVHVQGNTVSLKRRFSSTDELVRLIGWVHFALPVVLNLSFPDAPVVNKVIGTIGREEFIWAYANYPWKLDVTAKQIQEQRFLESWQRLTLLLPQENVRLFAALNYLHSACRLALAGINPWEFMGEILLNFAKILQVLFPAAEAQTIDAARAGLRSLGYTFDDIEKWYIPAIALRNELDSAHVSLVVLEQEQLQVVHDYTGQAEEHFRELLVRVVDRVAAGTFSLPQYEGGTRYLVRQPHFTS